MAISNCSIDLIYQLQLIPSPVFLYVSPSSVDLTGYTPEEFYADPNLGIKMMESDVIPSFKSFEHSKIKSVNTFKKIFKKKEGVDIWVEVNNTNIYDDEGNVASIIGVGRDITESVAKDKKLENELVIKIKIEDDLRLVVDDLKNSKRAALNILEDLKEAMIRRDLSDFNAQLNKKLFKTIFEEAPLGIALIKFLTGDFIEVNQKFAQITGRSQEELISTNWMSITHPDDLPEDLTNMSLMNAGKLTGFQMNKRYIIPNGSFVWISMTISALQKSSFAEPFHLCMIEDISQRKLTEVNLAKALERYHIISNATSDTIWDWDMINDTIEYNEGLIKMLGYQNHEIMNASIWWTQNLHPDDRKRIAALIEKACNEKQETLVMRYQYICSDKSSLYILDRATINYDELGKPIRMIGAMQDITKEELSDLQMDKAIVEAQERERQQMGMELHDNIIQLLAAGLIYQDLAEEKQKNQKEFGETLEKSTKYVNEAIAEIRKLSHQLAPAALVHFSLKAAFETLLTNMNLGKKLIIDINIEELDGKEVPSNIQTNLYRILQEQMNNIYKHAESRKVKIHLWLKGNFIYLEIMDNGKGFILNNVKSGIGIQNMRRRTEIFSGSFTCTTSPGKGCLLLVKIPLPDAIKN